MSDRLVEFLVPPKGCKLRIVKFIGWSKEKGPGISQFEIRPSGETIDKSRREFAKFLTRSNSEQNSQE